jgi:hypothetical protein
MADESTPKAGKSGGVAAKVVAAVFASIIAPIAVTFGVKWVNKMDAPPTEKAAPAAEKEAAPKEPTFGVIDLVTPNLADHFYQYGWNEEEKKDTRSDVIDPNVFRYEKQPGRIFVAGNGRRRAVLTTKAEYEDYTLNVWYRWGEKPPINPKGPPGGYPRKGSVGVHVAGSDGTVSGVFGQGVAIRIGEGQFGTINLNALPGVLTCKAKVVETVMPDKKRRRVFSPDAPAIPISSGEPEAWMPPFILQRGFPASAMFNNNWDWIGEGVGQGWHPEGDPTIKTVCPPYGPNDWNRVRIDCHGATVKVHVNGKVMNEITDLNVHRGRISISSMGADWELGRFEIETKPPAKTPQQPAEKQGR